jgi:hypothetical protein
MRPLLLVLSLLVSVTAITGCTGLVSSQSTPLSSLVITNVQTASTTTATAQIAWTTNVPADSSVDYGTTTSYGYTTPVDSTMVTAHQVTLSGLAAGTTYYYQVNSTDANNNHGKSGGHKFGTVGVSISGTITPTQGGSGAMVTLSGTASASTTTDSTGAYSFAGLASGSYGITPSNAGYTFTPASQNVTAGTTNITGLNFTASTTATGPTITTQPANQTVTAGQTATFTVVASGTAPLSYQWQKNGVAIPGAASSSYTTPATTSADSGSTFAAVVSNSAGTVTSNSATLTVNASSTSTLGISPTSLSFVNVNVGSSSSQNVTVTNTGNSNVTISAVTTSGAGFSATGLSANTILTPSQSATLSVSFAPAAAGSVTGSVSVASNATNSPTVVTLSGSGVASTATLPTCGKSGDGSNHVPADWTTFVPPAKGQSYVDPTFGCAVTRVTDASKDDWSGSFYLPLNMGYATVSPFNGNDTLLMLVDGWGRHFVTDLLGNISVPIANMPSANDTWFLWDATNASVFYYTNGNSLMKGTISGSSVATATVHQFSEYAAINFMDETDVSQDGAHVVIIGGDATGASPENVFDYNLVTNTKGPVYTTTCTGAVDGPNNSCLHKLIQTPDNNVIIQFGNDGSGPEQGNRLWNGTLPFPHMQDGTNHLDTGTDMNGNAVFIEVGNSSTLSGEANPCPSGWGLDVRMIYNLSSAVCLLDNQPSWHVGYRGNAQQPWVGLSFFDQGRSPSPEWFDNSANYVAPTASNWQLYEDEIMVVRVDANNNSTYAYRLARAYSRSNEDFNAQPKAAISRSGKYIAFDSNMAYAHTGCPANSQTSTNCTDVYIIKLQ